MEQLLKAKNPVLFHHNGIGDRLLGLPSVRAISSLFPGRLKLLCATGDREIFYSDLDLEGAYETEIWRGSTEWTFDVKAAADAVGECDLFMCLNPWFSDDISEFMSYFPSAETVGFFRSPFKHPCPFNDYDAHSIDGIFAIPQMLQPTLRVEDFAQPLQLPSKNIEDARRLRAQIPDPFRVMVIHTETGANKMWPVERYVSVLDKFFARHPDYVAFVVDGKDRGLNTGKFGANVFPCPQLPLATAFALISEADLFLGIDSCMLHAADFFRVPGVGLFGPTYWEEFGFRLGGPHRHAFTEVRKGVMEDLDEDAVLSALESIVAETRHSLIKAPQQLYSSVSA
jgi:hypothetical protein